MSTRVRGSTVVITKEVPKIKTHRCQLPTAINFGAGTECQCDCGKKYIVKVGESGWGAVGHQWVSND